MCLFAGSCWNDCGKTIRDVDVSMSSPRRHQNCMQISNPKHDLLADHGAVANAAEKLLALPDLLPHHHLINQQGGHHTEELATMLFQIWLHGFYELWWRVKAATQRCGWLAPLTWRHCPQDLPSFFRNQFQQLLIMCQI